MALLAAILSSTRTQAVSMHSYAVQPISPSSSLIGAFFLPA
jgi:hypothetical protein